VTVTVAASPYKGLVPFGESDLDAVFFFGREREVDVIAANLLASRLTVLYGATGVGKTSVLRAGAVRALRAVPFPRAVVVFDTWADDPARRLVETVAEAAGIAPRESLAETLADAGALLDGELYLVLDQFEEYFVYHDGALQEGSFTAELASALTQANVRANVLLSLREDALARLDVLKTRVPALFANYLRLDPLDRASARAAILGPVGRWNELFAGDEPVTVEPALVEAVLDQVEAGRVVRMGAGRGVGGRGTRGRVETPYLQLVLERLWEVERSRASRTLRLDTLEELGGASSIVGDHLRRALGELGPAEQDVAATIFHHLVTPSGSKIAHTAGDLARYASLDEGQVRLVAGRLVAARVLRPVPGGRYEIFHDVLAQPVLDWSSRFSARQTAELRRKRATTVAAVAVGALAIVAAVAIYALVQRSRASDRARDARAGELTAQALVLQATDPQAALAQALEASRLRPGTQTEEVLRSSLMAARLRSSLPTGSPVGALAWAASGRVAVGGADGRVRLWETATGRTLEALRASGPVRRIVQLGHGPTLLVVARSAELWDTERGTARRFGGTGSVRAAAASAGGDLIALVRPGGVEVRRARDGSLVSRIADPGALDAAFARDGRTVAVTARDTAGHVTASTYDTASGALLGRSAQRGVDTLAFSPDSTLLATGSADGTVVLQVPRTGGVVRVLDDGGKGIRDIAFSPDGTLLATASSDGGVRVWKVADGSRYFYLLGHTAAATGVVFSPDGTYLASTSDDHTSRIWTVEGVEEGLLAAVLTGSSGPVTQAAFSPGGHSLVTGGTDGTARLWEPRSEQLLTPVATDPAAVDALRTDAPGLTVATVSGGRVRLRRGPRTTSFAQGGRIVAFAGIHAIAEADGSTVAVRRVPGGAGLARLHATGPVRALAFGGDGDELAGVSGGVVSVWALPSGRLVHSFPVEPGVVRLAVSAYGLVATGDDDGTVRLRTPDGRLLHVLRRHRRAVTDLRFDAAGERLVSASEGASENAVEWEVPSGRLLHVLVGHFGTVNAISFSADGRWILTAGPISAGIWEAATGQRLFYVRGVSSLLTDAEWAPSGYGTVAGERDGTIAAYRCVLCRPLGSLQALAEHRLDG